MFPSNECSHEEGCYAEAPGPVLVRAQGGEETKDAYSTDAMPVGRCHEGESLDQCTAGGNAFGDPEYNEGRCKKGQLVGVKVVCTNFAAVRARDYYPRMPPAGTAFVPEVHYNGQYYPICGHYFWDDNGGAESVCKSLG